jgi:hypothetical protein
MPKVPPPAPVPENPIEELRERNAGEGIVITGEEGQPKLGYAPVNLANAVDGILSDVQNYREDGT